MKSLLLNSPEETRNAGALIGKLLRAGDVIALEGDLGSGKTTLTQGIALGMGVRQYVNSPTYSIIHEYEGAIPLFHCDPYRLESADALALIGFEEYFERGGVVIVEWANLVSELLPDERLSLVITTEMNLDRTFEDTAVRKLQIKSTGARYVEMTESIFRSWESESVKAI